MLLYYSKHVIERAYNVLLGYGLRNHSEHIDDHLDTLRFECAATHPKLIIELGTRGGKSTRVLADVAATFDARLVSVDIADCGSVCSYQKWEFVQSDDIEFATKFPEWCTQRGFQPTIDFLFIDTSHTYEQTYHELCSWMPFLRGRAAFHDTNDKSFVRMKNGKMLVGNDYNQGVMRALQRYFGFIEWGRYPFTIYHRGWRITHHPYSSGMTIVESVQLL